MIVPRPRLLLWTGGVGLPFLALGSVLPAAAPVAAVALGAVLAVAILDVLASRNRLRGVRVGAPALQRLTRGLEGDLEIRLHQPAREGCTVRVGLGLPAAVHTRERERTIRLLPGTGPTVVRWPCTGRRRGSFILRHCYLERRSRFGLWSVRSSRSVDTELRVYPDLRGERRGVAAIFLRRGLSGVHAQRMVGKGREFEKLRDYIPGDGYDEIHWKATAKRGHPITKVFQVERTQEVYVVLDASRLAARELDAPSSAAASGVEGEPVLERFIAAALVFGLAAEQQGDRFGFLAFSDRVTRFVRASGGRAHFRACREALISLQPETVSPDFEGLCSFIRLRLRRRALLILLTSVDDPVLADSLEGALDLIRGQHLVMVTMIRPSGVQPLFSRAPIEDVGELYSELAGHLRWSRLRERGLNLQRKGVPFHLVENSVLTSHLVGEYLRIKQRQAL